MAERNDPIASIIGFGPAIDDLRAQIRRLATFDTPGNANAPTVLLQGETGTGKGLVARAMHASGGRARAPFVDVNCAAIPDTMLEAELFGYEAGAFTDAKRAKPGLFEVAAGGTLFLDEIDALPLALQGKLLKAIEEKTIRRLGGVASQHIDVKLIAATQRDLVAMLTAGRFRADLYHRLAVVVLEVPPLRARRDDVLGLAEHFLARHAAAHAIAPKRLDAGARAWLAAHRWPGNVRELSHLMERVTLLAPDAEVDGTTLARLCVPFAEGRRAESASDTEERSDTYPDARARSAGTVEEPARIRDALARSGGNVVGAARLLGLGRNALRHRMQRYGIARPTLDAPALPGPPAGAPPADVRTPRRAPEAQPTWEQRSIAVLAIDVVLPDDVHEPWTIARRWEQRIAERVAGFGGVFLTRSPSRMTAAFGIPRALEQLPQRAVHAALTIRRLLADDDTAPELRMAVHLGMVRFDASAPDDTTRVLPLADTLALPERLLGHAAAGEILVSPPIARRVESSCELRPRDLRVGEAGMLHASAVGGPRTRAGVTDGPPTTTFVGREGDLGQLREAFAAAAGGAGTVVFLVGDAGIGKSRLLAEFRRRLGDTPLLWLEGRCASYGMTTAFLPIVDLLRRLFALEEHDDVGTAQRKIARGIEALGDDLEWTTAYVAQLFGLASSDGSSPPAMDAAPAAALDSATRRSETFRALKELLRAASARRPVLVVIEDLHWIDAASEELLAFLGDAVPTMRVLMVCSHRPGYRHAFGDHSYHLRVSLRMLSADEMAAVSGSLLGTMEVPPQVRTLIAAKAEGNPFFVEELTRSLLEDGTLRRENGGVVLTRDPAAIILPDTIQDVLGARLDRLAADARRAIQVASVIGREFALRLLERIIEAGARVRTHVDELRTLELIYEKTTHPELAYMFKHALTHDVAYESVVAERRRELHRTIALAIEELYAERLAEFYETLAHHFGRAAEWERALEYHARAAEKAAESFANRSVIAHCREALAIADRLGERVADERRAALAEQLGLALFYVSEFSPSGEAFDRAAGWSTPPTRRAGNLTHAAVSYLWGHEYEVTARTTERIREIAERAGLPLASALALSVEAFSTAVCGGDVAGEKRMVIEALRGAEASMDEATVATMRFYLAQNAEWSGDYRQAIALSEQVIDAGRRLRLAHLVVWPGWFLGKAACCLGAYGRALTQLQEAYEFCDRIGDRAWKCRLLNTMGWALGEIGAHARARAFDERAAALAREIGDPEIIANSDINRAADLLALGERDDALACIVPIRDALARPGDPWMRWRYSLHAFDVLGRIALDARAPHDALAYADDELAGARRYGAPKVEARALVLRGAALLALERRADADAALADAARTAEAIAYPRGVWRALALRATVARRDGRASDAARHAARRDALVTDAARSLGDDDLRRVVVDAADSSLAR